MKDVKNRNGDKLSEDKASDKNSRIYELGYLLMPAISEEDLPAVYGNLKELIASLGGEMISDEMPKMVSLAYPMFKVIQNARRKFDTAHFGWIKFEIDPEKILDLKKDLNLRPDIIRFLILKTVRENTIAANRFVRRDIRPRTPVAKKEGEDDVAVPFDKEEIDKEIDAMVAV